MAVMLGQKRTVPIRNGHHVRATALAGRCLSASAEQRGEFDCRGHGQEHAIMRSDCCSAPGNPAPVGPRLLADFCGVLRHGGRGERRVVRGG